MKRIIFYLSFVFILCISNIVDAAEITENDNDSSVVENYSHGGTYQFIRNNEYIFDELGIPNMVGLSRHGSIEGNDNTGIYITRRSELNDFILNDKPYKQYTYRIYYFKIDDNLELLVTDKCTEKVDYLFSEDAPYSDTQHYERIEFSEQMLVPYNEIIGVDLLVVDGIPIFDEDDKDSIDNYIKSGDVSGALNDDIFPDEKDESIPLPHNLKVVSGNQQQISQTENYPRTFNKDIVIAWEQKDVIDNLVADVECSITHIEKDSAFSLEARESTSSYYDIVRGVAYNGDTSFTLKIEKSQLNSLRDVNDLLLSKVTFRVRNRVGKKTSDWVRITIDLKSGKVTATEEDYNDSSDEGGDEYNNTDIGPGSNDNGSVNVNGVLDYIKGGFGLLGNTGIISLMSQCFLYLPGNVWSIIYFYISMIVVVAIFSFFVKVVF